MSRHIALPFRIAQRLMGSRDIGRMKLRGLGEGLHGGIVPHHEIEHMRQKARVGGGAAQRVGSDPAFGQERTQPLGIAGYEGKRLNRNDFSHFPGISAAFSQALNLPFRNLWSLVSKQSCPSLQKHFKQVETILRKLAGGLNALERIWR